MNRKVGQASRLPRRRSRPHAITPLALARSPGSRDACPTLGPLRYVVPMRCIDDMGTFNEGGRIVIQSVEGSKAS